jgi:cell division protein FtsB|tara:strand:+ start:482 stop:844 length:363 start_codon:yes stop_codon:yes gene_type:complete
MSKYGSMRRPASKISTKKHIASIQKSFVRGVLLLFLATLLIIFVFGDHGLLQLYKLKQERSKIQNHISELRKNREELIQEKSRLENDLKYIEKLAREKYRMAKPGEKVFKVMPKKKDIEN